MVMHITLNRVSDFVKCNDVKCGFCDCDSVTKASIISGLINNSRIVKVSKLHITPEQLYGIFLSNFFFDHVRDTLNNRV